MLITAFSVLQKGLQSEPCVAERWSQAAVLEVTMALGLYMAYSIYWYGKSKALLDYLYGQLDQSQFTCRFDWQPGTVTFWDNRLTGYFAQNDDQGQASLMHCITIVGCELASA